MSKTQIVLTHKMPRIWFVLCIVGSFTGLVQQVKPDV